MFLRRFFPGFLALLALTAPRLAPAQIQAEVQVAGAVTGAFTIDLEYLKAPTTVANFIGLATGQRPWLDYATGAIRHDGYYNGVTFHRVIAGFMNQTGSRKGDGTDGPGYVFRDEFEPTLRHDAAYVVSMANSGRHSNGAQFFITVSPQAQLNDKHSVFGRVIAGQAIIDQINAVQTTGAPTDRPLTPIVIQSITVSGPSLAGFNLHPTTLPPLVDALPVLTKSGATHTLGYDARSYSDYTGFRSTDLATWTRFKSAYYTALAPSGADDVTALATGARHFFRMARVDYDLQASRLIPFEVGGKSFAFPNGFFFPVTIALNAAGTGGTWSFTDGPSGTLHTATYTPGPFTSRLYLRLNSTAIYGFDIELLYTLDYSGANAGTHAAQSNVSGRQNFSGTFTMTP